MQLFDQSKQKIMKRKLLISMVDNLALQLNNEDWDNYVLAKLIRLRRYNNALSLYVATLILSAGIYWSWVCLHDMAALHQSMLWLIQKLILCDQYFALIGVSFVFLMGAFATLRLLFN